MVRRPDLTALAMELVPVFCYAGIAALLGLLALAERSGLVDAVYVPLALAALALAVGTITSGVGWFLAGEPLVGGFVAGLRGLSVIALFLLMGQAFEAGTKCSGDCAYFGAGLGTPLLAIYLLTPLVSACALYVYFLRARSRRVAAGR
jgi:hypothetical protein